MATDARAQTEPFKTFLGTLSAASALAGTESFPCLQSTVTKACTPAQLGTYIAGTSPTIAGNWTFNGNIVLGTGVLQSPAGGIQIQGSGAGVTQFQSANASGTSYTLTFPAATDQLVGRATTDTLTGKTIAFASNTLTGVAPLASPTFTGVVITSNTDASAASGSGALQVPGGASVAKRFWLPAITTSAGFQTAVLCQSSGGEVIADSVACLASSERFKTVLGPLEDGALDKLVRLPLKRWHYNADGIFQAATWMRERIGPTAEDVAAIDERLAGYGSDGSVRTFSPDQLLALVVKAIQEQQAQIAALQARLP